MENNDNNGNFNSDYNNDYNNGGYQNNGYYNADTGEYHYSYADSNSNLNNETFFKTNVTVRPEKPKKPKKKYGFWVIALSVILATAVGALSSLAVFVYLNQGNSAVDNRTVTYLPSVDTSSENKAENASSSTGTSKTEEYIIENKMSSIAQAVAKKCTKSVIGIRTTASVYNFFGGSSEESGEGSGVIYTSDGYIVTNYHVIEGAASSRSAKIEVFLESSSSKSYSASIIGYNIAADIAVIKINATGLTPAKIGNSDKLEVGQYAITIGAPGGLEFMGSVTYGVISGLNRSVSTSSGIGLIQTDAAINPGNSGGALLDESGKLIGINSSKIVSEEFEGMGFAIPVNKVVEICNNIIAKKGSKEPYVGITISEKYTAEVLEYYGYPTGAVVLSVASGSPADETGIRKGDIITEFNGVTISEYTVYQKTLAACTPGSTVSVKIYRNGRYYTAKIEIDSNYAQ